MLNIQNKSYQTDSANHGAFDYWTETDLCLRAFSLDTRLDNIVRKKKNKKTIYLSASVFSTKVPIENVIFVRLFVETGPPLYV